MPEARTIRLLAIIEAFTVTGPAKNLVEFARLAREAYPGFETSIATFVRPGHAGDERENEFLIAVAEAGLNVYLLRERFPLDVRALTGLKECIRRVRPDLIETHGVKSHLFVRLSGAWREYPWVAFHHGYTADAPRTAIYNQFDRWSLRAPARIITVCQPFKRQLVARGALSSRIQVLHNAIDSGWNRSLTLPEEAKDKSATAQDENGGGERVILAVGRLSAEKAFPDLVRAIAALHQRRPELRARLLIAGEGPGRKQIEQSIRSSGLENRVEILGHVSDPSTLYRRADAVVISSKSEGSPNVLLEAMAAGVPVVATRVGGIPEIVSDGQSALLVPPADPLALADAIERVLAEPELARRLAMQASRLVRERFSPAVRMQTLMDIYLQLLQDTKGKGERARVVSGG
jgi:glycosyltransferase involved in cell wall biosynthesis